MSHQSEDVKSNKGLGPFKLKLKFVVKISYVHPIYIVVDPIS